MKHLIFCRIGMVSLFILLVVTIVLGQESPHREFVRYITTWGEEGSGPGQLKEPGGLSVDPSGFLYIADTRNQRIQKWDAFGRFVAEIGGFGWREEQFDDPFALSARNGLDVFVADMQNQRVERYDKDLHYLATLNASEDWPEHLQFGFPRDVALFATGELFCLDGENHRVLKLDILGVPQRSFGDFDSGEGRLVYPRRLALSDQGNVYVSDWEPPRIVVFDLYGNYRFTFGEGIMQAPSDLFVLLDETVLVADGQLKTVFVFQKSGGLLGSFGGEHGFSIRFEEPVDVACWRNRLFVLDQKRCVVDVFQWIYAEGDRQ